MATAKRSSNRTRDESYLNVLLKMHNCAQQSAEHHDKLAYNVTSILFVLMGGLLVLILSNLEALVEFSVYFIRVIVLVGITIILLVWRLNNRFDKLINERYQKCKDIEDELKGKFDSYNKKLMEVHLDEYPIRAKCGFRFLFLMLIGIWLLVLWYSFSFNPQNINNINSIFYSIHIYFT